MFDEIDNLFVELIEDIDPKNIDIYIISGYGRNNIRGNWVYFKELFKISKNDKIKIKSFKYIDNRRINYERY